jgi:hypothetical protein
MESLIADTITAINELPEIKFDCRLSTVLPPGELQINMEYNLDDYKVLRRKLCKDYKFLRHWFHKTLGSYFVQFEHKRLNVKLDIQLKLKEDGGTACKLEIDHWTKPEPVYKVICE